MKLALACITDKIIEQYIIRTLSSDGWVYLEIRKGMPGLEQAGSIANNRLKARLSQFGFAPVPRTLALWKHDNKPIFSPSSLTTLASSTSEKITMTNSSKPSRNSTPYPLTGLVPSSTDSPSTGNMLHTPVTSPCQSIYKKTC